MRVSTALRDGLLGALQVRSDEVAITSAFGLLSFCMGMSIVFYYTAVETLFLSQFSLLVLPWTYVVGGVLVALVGLAYTRMGRALSLEALTTANLVVTGGGIVLVWGALRSGYAPKALVFAAMAGSALLSMLIAVAFGGLSSRLFHLRQAKRVFALIGSGDVVARILGGLLIPVVVRWVGVTQLLLGSALGMVLALGVLRYIIRRFGYQHGSEAGQDPPQAAPIGLTKVLTNGYYRSIMVLAAMGILGYYIVKLMFFDQLQQLPGPEAIASFLGLFSAVMGIANLGVRSLVTGQLLARFGVGVALLTLPVGLLLVAVPTSLLLLPWLLGAAMQPFWPVVLMHLLSKVFDPALTKPAIRLLYQPLHPAQRLRMYTLVEGIVEPAANALTGGLLLVFAALSMLGVSYMLPLTMAVTLLWVLAGYGMRRRYIDQLLQSSQRRILVGEELSLTGPATRAVARRALSSPHPAEATYALQLLWRAGVPRLEKTLLRALSHAHAQVRVAALGLLEQVGTGRSVPAVRRLVKARGSTDLGVKSAALLTYCALNTHDMPDRIEPYLENPEPALRRAAMVGLLRHGGLDSIVVVGGQLSGLFSSLQVRDRAFAATLLGDVGARWAYRPVRKLLQDPDLAVRRAALGAAAHINHHRLCPSMVAALFEPQLVSAASLALLACKESPIPALEKAFNADSVPSNVRIRMVRVTGRIGGNLALSFLGKHLDWPDLGVRFEIHRALAHMGFRPTASQRRLILRLLDKECAQAPVAHQLAVGVGQVLEVELLHRALVHERNKIERRILCMLELLYPGKAIRSVVDQMAHNQTASRALGLEIIDQVASRAVRNKVIPALEPKLADHQQPVTPRVDLLKSLAYRPPLWCSPWTRSCAVGALGALDSSISQEPRTVLRTRPGHTPFPEITLVFTLERVTILKSVRIFTQTADELLAAIATSLQDSYVQAGERIFAKGDVGDSMYIIVDGRVRVHDGKYTITELGAREVFGELAVLDPEPRMASVTAIEDTRLFRLDQHALHELIADHAAIAQGIIRVLCRRLRSKGVGMVNQARGSTAPLAVSG